MDLEGGGSKSQSVVTGFMNHMLEFETDTKREVLNIIQYSVLALIPLVVLNKAVSNVVPEANDMKSTMEISIEVIGQTIAMLIGLMVIDRLVSYVPPYSGSEYEKRPLLTIVLPMFMILLSLQTKIGEKTNILYIRLMGVWNGDRGIQGFQEGHEDEEGEEDPKEGYSDEVRTRQPIAQARGKRDDRVGGVQYPAPQGPAPQMMNAPNVESRPQIAQAQSGGDALGTYSGGDSFSSSFSTF